jgi:hypothetical protein
VSSHTLERLPALVAPRHESLDRAVGNAQEAAVPGARQRAAGDVPLDLLRGLAMVILVVNHLRLESALGHLASSVLSAAEVLVAVSGVGCRHGLRTPLARAPPPRATTAVLLRRSRKLYLASVAVVALVGALTLLYVAGYCAFRIVDELLRVDPAAHVFGLRWNLLLAIAGTAIGLAWFAATQRGGQHRVAPPSPALTQR